MVLGPGEDWAPNRCPGSLAATGHLLLQPQEQVRGEQVAAMLAEARGPKGDQHNLDFWQSLTINDVWGKGVWSPWTWGYEMGHVYVTH